MLLLGSTIPRNNMRIRFSSEFAKQHEKANPKIKTSFDKRLALFKENPLHPHLGNHPLSGKFSRYRSINVTGDWRALYTEHHVGEEVIIIFKLLGTHSQLYG